MKLIVGLGNPGPKYETTRHNAGFIAVDHLVDEWKAQGPTKKHQAEIYETEIDGEKVLLIKPQTFMNLSGRSVAPFFQFYHCQAEDLIVLHDDLDLPPVAMRIKTGGGTGGHKGLKSIDECIGTANNAYHRIRLGIGKGKYDQADHVLTSFKDEEVESFNLVLEKIPTAVRLLIQGKAFQAMNEFNKKEKVESEG